MKSGIINVYKEAGYTSFDVVARLRGILHIKKIGHTGTLDPEATGVLPVCIGKATKVCDLLTDKDKEYVAVMRLGFETDTQDMTGCVLDTHEVRVTEEQLKIAASSFVGEIEQIPPMYSALKVQGQKLCDLARKGVTVERKARKVTVYDLTILSVEIPLVTMKIHCSRGTYVRTICHDMGQLLGCGAAMESLVRTRVADFSISQAHKLDEIADLVKMGESGETRLNEMILPVDQLFLQYSGWKVKAEAVRLLQNGNKLMPNQLTDQKDPSKDAGQCKWDADSLIRVYFPEDEFAGLYQWKENQFIPYKMFL